MGVGTATTGAGSRNHYIGGRHGASDWANRELFAAIMMVLPIPLMIVAERIWTKRTDWLLEPKEMIEDVGWIAAGYFIWVPLTATTTKPRFLRFQNRTGYVTAKRGAGANFRHWTFE